MLAYPRYAFIPLIFDNERSNMDIGIIIPEQKLVMAS